MLVRLILLFIVAGGLWTAWRALRPHPLARISLRWRLLGRQSPLMAEALRIRASIVRILLRGHGAGTSGLVNDVDRLLESIANAVELQAESQNLTDQTKPNLRLVTPADSGVGRGSIQRGNVRRGNVQLRDALTQLGRAHHHLLDTARAEIDVAIADVRDQLGEQTDYLRLTVAAQREVEQMLAGEEPDQPSPNEDETP